MALILNIRELLWFLFKSANFPKICDIYYWIGKYSKSFLWIYNSAAIDNVIVNGGITTGKNCQFMQFPEFIIPIYNIRELLWFSPKLTNFLEN